MKIFIIEDDFVLRNELITFLQNYGYTCETTDNFKNIIEESLNSKPDLILLDINLPYIDGYHVCKEIRKQSSVPIIVVTSRNNDMDELMSINLGADDFVTKPYNTQILLARIGAVLKRSEKEYSSDEITYKQLTLNTSKSIVKFEEKSIELTKNELHILSFLISHKEKIVSRNALMDELWQSDEFVDDNTLTVNINRLRKKLESIGAKNFIETRRGQGYII